MLKKLVPWKEDGSFRAITFDRHLFYPLLDKKDESFRLHGHQCYLTILVIPKVVK